MKFYKARRILNPNNPLLLSMPVSAGHLSPGDDHVKEHLDITRLLVERPDATFFVRVEGESITDASIEPGDILVVDRSIEARHNDIVLALADGEFTVKIVDDTLPLLRLVGHETLPVTEESPFEVWGVVLWVVHKAR